MTETEKAKELFNHFYDSDMGGYGYLPKDEAKKQAIYVVSEIQKAGCQEIVVQYFDDRYWNEVETEIKKL